MEQKDYVLVDIPCWTREMVKRSTKWYARIPRCSANLYRSYNDLLQRCVKEKCLDQGWSRRTMSINGKANDSRKFYAKHFLIAAPQRHSHSKAMKDIKKIC